MNSIDLAHSKPRVGSQSDRFTIDGSDALEQNLAALCQQVLAGIRKIIPPRRFEGLLLAGGYGRGEGGVLRINTSDAPYNDLEFYLFLPGNPRLNQKRFGHPLHELCSQLSSTAGMDVEVKIISRSSLQRAPVSMFSYDLASGHRWISGNDSLLAGCQHHLDATQIPLHEATRLLMNRCSGLLFAKERLQRKDWSLADADFVGRNLAKARLAFGDVLLAASGQYHWSCLERHQRLLHLPNSRFPAAIETVRLDHADGVQFKLHPFQETSPPTCLLPEHNRLTSLALSLWLWLEQKRLNKPFPSAAAYAHDPLDKCPETRPWKNRLINAHQFGLAASLGPSGARYPRQRLFHALAILLWADDIESEIPFLQKTLHTNAVSFQECVQAYTALWQRFN